MMDGYNSKGHQVRVRRVGMPQRNFSNKQFQHVAKYLRCYEYQEYLASEQAYVHLQSVLQWKKEQKPMELQLSAASL